MKWKIQYRIKGSNNIRTEVIDVYFDKKNDVKNWWLGKTSTFVDYIGSKTIGGLRQDNEFINCFKIQ